MNCDVQKPMSGADVARQMGITRQAVSFSIRKSLKKMYRYVLREKIADTPFQAMLALMSILQVNSNSQKDIQEFLKMFDKDTVDIVVEDAKATYNIRD